MLSYIEINKQNLLHNAATLKSYVAKQTKIMYIVKGNAYGHGLAEVTRILEPAAGYFAVISIEDLRLIRQVTSKPVLVLGYIGLNDLPEAVALNGTLAVYDQEHIARLDEIGRRLNQQPKMHLKIDASLGRQGVLVDELSEFLKDIQKYQHVEMEGVYAHFANIEDTQDFSHARRQIDEFAKAKQMLREYGYVNLITHISSTAGSLVYEKGHGYNSMVRFGIGLYGLWPSPYIEADMMVKGIELRPVMRWVTHLAQIKQVPAGFTIGYGLTYRTARPMKIAVVPQGYGDGYDRGLSNQGHVLVHGVRCPVLGRVAMNMFVIDVSHIPSAKAEDEVVLLGMQGNECIAAEELATQLDTINYEITTRISPLLPRVII